MTRATFTAGAAAAAAMWGAPAEAHPGPHHGMSFAELGQHLATGWHLLTLVGAAAAIGVAVVVVTRWREVAMGSVVSKPGGRT